MQLKQEITFKGGLNRDDDPRELPQGDYITLANARTGSPDEQQDEGNAVSLKETTYRAKTVAYASGTTIHLGLAVDLEKDKTYVLLFRNVTQEFTIEEFDVSTNTYSKILEVPASGWGIDGDLRFINPKVVFGNLILTDNVNPIRMINIERARTSLTTGVGYPGGEKPVIWDETEVYSPDEYIFYINKFYKSIRDTSGTRPDITPIDWEYLCDIEDAYASMDADVFLFEAVPALIAAIPTYQSDTNIQVNNIEKSVYQFSYRYTYMDYRKSTYAPPSIIPAPDGEETSAGIFNKDVAINNSIKITLAAPGPDVRNIEVIGRSSEDPASWFLIDKVSIVNENGDRSIGYDLSVDLFWYNDRVQQAVDTNEVIELFTYVPIRARLMEIIEGNRAVFANIVEGYSGVRPLVSMTLSYQNLLSSTETFPMSAGPSIKEQGPAGSPDDIIWVLITSLPYSGEVGAVYKVTVKPDGLSELSAQYTMLAGDVGTYPTSVKNGLAAAMTVAGIPTTACALGTSDYSVCYHEKQTHQSSYPYTGWTYSAEVITPLYLNKYPHLKFGSTHKLAMIYRDRGGRISPVIRDLNFDLTIPFYTQNTSANMNTIPVADLEISHNPLDWAESYEILYAGNETVILPLQLKATGWAVDGDYWKFQIEETLSTMYDKRSGWRVSSYQWTEGDRVRLIGLSDGSSSVTEENGVLVDLEITKVEEDGGIDYLFIQATSEISIPAVGALYIVEIYTPVKELSETIYRTTGMTFLISTDGNGNKIHNGDTDQIRDVSGVTTTPGSVRITAHDVWKYRRINYNNAGTSTFTFWAESTYPSDWWTTQAMTSQGFPIPEIEGSRQVVLDKRLRFGGTLLPGTLVNNIANFDFDDYKDMQEQHGSISAIREVGYVLKVLQHHKLVSIYIGRVESHDGAGNKILTFTSKVLGTVRPSEEENGCQNPESALVEGRYLYFWDQKYGVVVRDAPNGQVIISDRKMKRLFLDKANEILTSVDDIEVIMGFNAKAAELWVTFRIFRGATETWVFNETRGRWVYRVGNFSDEYWSIGRRFFAEYRLRTEEYDDEAATGYLNFSVLEPDQEVEVEVVANMEKLKVKIFNALAVYVNQLPTCDRVLIPIEASEAEKETELFPANWNQTEGIWYGGILNDKNTPGVFDDDTDRLLNGRVMRGEYAQIRFKWGSTTSQLKLASIIAIATPSEKSR